MKITDLLSCKENKAPEISEVRKCKEKKSAKLRALRAHVPTCLSCLRAQVPM